MPRARGAELLRFRALFGELLEAVRLMDGQVLAHMAGEPQPTAA